MRVYNFAAGPSILPVPVLEQAQKELLDYQGTGMSIIEMSHRSKEYDAMHQETKALLRELMEIPEINEKCAREIYAFFHASNMIE